MNTRQDVKGCFDVSALFAVNSAIMNARGRFSETLSAYSAWYGPRLVLFSDVGCRSVSIVH